MEQDMKDITKRISVLEQAVLIEQLTDYDIISTVNHNAKLSKRAFHSASIIFKCLSIAGICGVVGKLITDRNVSRLEKKINDLQEQIDILTDKEITEDVERD